MELKVGQKVRIKTYNRRPGYWNSHGKMDKYMGKVVTIRRVSDTSVKIKEDKNENCDTGWSWGISDFVPLKFTKSDLQDGMMLGTANGERYLWLYGERKADFKEVLWDKAWMEKEVKEITAEEAAELLKEKFPEYEVKITV